MKDILEEIIAHKRLEVSRQKELLPPRRLYHMVEEMMSSGSAPLSMSQSLATDPYGIIAEFKRKSPSKGWIKEEGRPEIIPASYARNGAAALSILTDSYYFGGNLEYIQRARPLVTKPILRKDFIIDEYQIFEARHAGADAILLIAANLKMDDARHLITMAHELGDPATVTLLRKAGYRGFLMGEHFMRTPDPGAELAKFIGGIGVK